MVSWLWRLIKTRGAPEQAPGLFENLERSGAGFLSSPWALLERQAPKPCASLKETIKNPLNVQGQRFCYLIFFRLPLCGFLSFQIKMNFNFSLSLKSQEEAPTRKLTTAFSFPSILFSIFFSSTTRS